MVKSYLRYENERSVGVITSRECNVVLDPTGKLALTGCVEAVGVWSVRKGEQEQSLRVPKVSERVTHICLKGGEKPVCAAGYSDGSVRLWDYGAGAVLQTLQGHRSAVSCLAFDRTGHLLASGSKDTDIVVWDIVAESGLARLRGHIDQVTALLLWEGDGPGGRAAAQAQPRVVSASKDRFVRIWSVELQLCLQVLPEHQGEVWSLALNAAQTRLAAGSGDSYLRLWALDTAAQSAPGGDGSEAQLAVFLGAVPRQHGQGSALAMQFVQPKGLDAEVLLCLSAGRVLEMFRCHLAVEVKKRQRRRKRRATLKRLKKADGSAAQPDEEENEDAAGQDEPADGDAAAAEEEGARAADELAALAPHRFSAKAASLSWCAATGVVLAGLSNNSLESVRLVPAEGEGSITVEPGLAMSLPGHRTGVRSLAVAHDDSLVMSTSAEAVKIWSVPTGRCVRTMPSGYGLCGFFVAGNEHALVGTKEGKLELFDLRVAELAQAHEAHAGAVYTIAERPDHKGLVSGGADKHIRFFEFTFTKGASESVTFEELVDRATELPDEVLSVAYSPDGKYVAAALLNHTIQLFFDDTLKFYLSLYGHRLPALCLDISSDSQMVASGSADKNVKLWSVQFGNCHRSLRAHDESVMQVRFLPGTHYLASAGRDRTLKLWDCDTYQLITTLTGHATEILALSLSQDAAFIVTASSDRQLRFWRRGGDQLFLSEERAKELEDRFEEEAAREDVQGPAGGEVTSLRPSRRTLESVRSTERLVEILDEATAAESGEAPPSLMGQGAKQHPCVRVVTYINTLTAGNIYEVLLALPFGHALRLLQFVCRFLEGVSALPVAGASAGAMAQTKALAAAAALETPCQAALITAYVHHSELAVTPSARALLLRLRQQMRTLLQAEKDRIGLCRAGFSHLQRVLKRSGGFAPPPQPQKPGAAAKRPRADGAKRKRGGP